MRDRVGAVDMRHPLLPELPPQRAGEEAVRDEHGDSARPEAWSFSAQSSMA